MLTLHVGRHLSNMLRASHLVCTWFRRKIKSLFQGDEEDDQEQLPQEQENDDDLDVDMGGNDKPTFDHEGMACIYRPASYV